MRKIKHIVKVEVLLKSRDKIAEVVIKTTPEAVKEPNWKDVEAKVIEEVESKLQRENRSDFKIIARVELDEDKKDNEIDDKALERILDEMRLLLIDDEKMKEAFKGFTPAGLKKAEKIFSQLEQVSYNLLFKKAECFENYRDRVNWVIRVPVLMEINKAGLDVIKGSAGAVMFLKSLGELFDVDISDPKKLLRAVLEADTKMVLEVSSAILTTLLELKEYRKWKKLKFSKTLPSKEGGAIL